ncbi:MAG: hypothetical protein EBT03_11260 [Betaproteobacteria bacterium]|nr:hypothetical protein [Betaproteobacteria bacterium]NCA17174.1 hypothetical protein [Betaproteobacteria bacterium]
MFDSLYGTRDRILSLGKAYKPPKTFRHGEWEIIATLKKKHEDGLDVEVYECRLPARSFKVVVKDGTNSVGNPTKGFTLSTGSGEEMGELCGLIAKAASEGMIASE